MQTYWLRKEDGNKKLIIYILGWAGDPDVVRHLCPHDSDVLCIYHYTKLSPLDPQLCSAYDQVTLFAWSFGVWVAEQIAQELPLTKAVALNGTPYPVHLDYGMAPKLVLATLRGLQRVGMEPFFEKSYGQFYLADKPEFKPVSLRARYEELLFLKDASQSPYTPSIKWDKALIGSQDEIFTAPKMKAYWQDLAEIHEMPHYPFGDPSLILKELP